MSIKNRRFAGARLLAEPFENVTDLLQKLKSNNSANNESPNTEDASRNFFEDSFKINGRNVRLTASGGSGGYGMDGVELTDGKEYLGNRQTYEMLSEGKPRNVYTMAWDVDGSYGSDPGRPSNEADRRERLLIAREVQRRYRDMVKKMPEGSVVTNSPVGASSGDFGRADLYMASGFGPVQSNMNQYGIIKGGKIEPLSPMLPDERHAKHLAKRTRMAGDVGLSDKMLKQLSGNESLAERVYSPDDNAEFASSAKQGGYGGGYDDDDDYYYEDYEPPVSIEPFRAKNTDTRGYGGYDRDRDASVGMRPFDEINRREDAQRILNERGFRVPRQNRPDVVDIVNPPSIEYNSSGEPRRDYTPGEEPRIDPALIQEMRDFQVRAAMEQQPGGSLATDPRLVMMRALDASTPRALPRRISVEDLVGSRSRRRYGLNLQPEDADPGQRLTTIAANARDDLVRDTGEGRTFIPPMKSRNIDTASFDISPDPYSSADGRQGYIRQEAFSTAEIAEARAAQEQLARDGAYNLNPRQFEYEGTAIDGYPRPVDEQQVNNERLFSRSIDLANRTGGDTLIPIGNSGRVENRFTNQTEQDRFRLDINDGAPVRDRALGQQSDSEEALEELAELVGRQDGNSVDMRNARQAIEWFERYSPGYSRNLLRDTPVGEPMSARRLSQVLQAGATQPGRLDDEEVARALNQLYSTAQTDNSQRIAELTEQLGTTFRDPVARPVRRQMFAPDQLEMEVPGVGTLRRPNSPRNFILEALEADGAQLSDAPPPTVSRRSNRRRGPWVVEADSINRPSPSQLLDAFNSPPLVEVDETPQPTMTMADLMEYQDITPQVNSTPQIDPNDPLARPVGPVRRRPRPPLAANSSYDDLGLPF